MSTKASSIFDKSILVPAVADAFRKLNPLGMVRNPVMFVTLAGAVVTTAELAAAPLRGESVGFILQIAIWLWFTVLFANFAEAMAEGRGKAQAAPCASRARRPRPTAGVATDFWKRFPRSLFERTISWSSKPER
jgi:high-affinity K+ transport system ATPase subunit B